MRGEFIGLEVEVSASPHPGYMMSGMVVDETRNTFVIRRDGKDRVIPKAMNEFTFTYEGEKVKVTGSEVQYRPEDRIKRIK
jgi:ribonuclease P protein subunit POP4